MQDAVELPGDTTVIRENGYNTDGSSVVRVEVRSLICYTRTLVDNNNRFPVNSTPGFRLSDLSPDVLTVMQLYHEHRHANPCKYLIFSTFKNSHRVILVVYSVTSYYADDFS